MASSQRISGSRAWISERVSPHSLRRTYASLRFALRDDPVYVAEQLGHTEAGFSMRVYAKAVRRRERLPAGHLEAFDRALQWAHLGANADLEPIEPSEPRRSAAAKRA